jgi:hypothetical protein
MTLAAHAPPDGTAEALMTITKLQDFFRVHQSHMHSEWLHNLVSTFSSRGCEVLADDEVPALPELGRAWSDNNLTVWMGVVGMMPEAEIPLPPLPGLPGSISKKGYADLVMRAAEESMKGAWVAMDQRVVVARKGA